MSDRKDQHRHIHHLTEKLNRISLAIGEADRLSQLDIDLLRKAVVDLYEAVITLRPVNSQMVNQKLMTEIAGPEQQKLPENEPSTTEKEALSEKITGEDIPAAHEETNRIPEKQPELPDEHQTDTPAGENGLAGEENTSEIITAADHAPEKSSETNGEAYTKTESSETKNNGTYSPTGKKDLFSRLTETPVSDLKKAIGIAKKFEYIHALFKGNHEQYTYAIHHLNNLSSGDEAFEYLNKIRTEQKWEEEDPNYLELASLVRRRFIK
jgi:hypothetical protein